MKHRLFFGAMVLCLAALLFVHYREVRELRRSVAFYGGIAKLAGSDADLCLGALRSCVATLTDATEHVQHAVLFCRRREIP